MVVVVGCSSVTPLPHLPTRSPSIAACPLHQSGGTEGVALSVVCRHVGVRTALVLRIVVHRTTSSISSVVFLHLLRAPRWEQQLRIAGICARAVGLNAAH